MFQTVPTISIDDEIKQLTSLEDTLEEAPHLLDEWDDFFVYQNFFHETQKNIYDNFDLAENDGRKKYIDSVCKELQQIFDAYTPIIAPWELWNKQTSHIQQNDTMYDELISHLDDWASLIHHANKQTANNTFSIELFDDFCGYVQELYSSKVQNTVAIVANNKHILFVNDRTWLWHIFRWIYQELLTIHCEQTIARTARFSWKIQNEIQASHDKKDERYRYHYTFDRMWSIVESFENTIQQRLPNDSKKKQHYKDLFWKRKKEFFHIKKLYDRICGESIFE